MWHKIKNTNYFHQGISVVTTKPRIVQNSCKGCEFYHNTEQCDEIHKSTINVRTIINFMFGERTYGVITNS